MRRTLLTFVGPLFRLFPPWWKARCYGRLIGDLYSKVGDTGGVGRRRVGPHGYEMELHLDDPMDRFAYFVGCYWGLDVISAISKLLRRGDYFIDVGANLGFLTLTASKKVGREGRVFAFEPFPAMADRLDQTLLNNRIDNVTVYRQALGDQEADSTLDLDDHCSKANLRGADKANGSGAKVKVLRGDQVLCDLPHDIWVFAKLDVEGYELRVLKGFQSLITRPKTGFLVEITDQWLRDLGGSADELFGVMMANGFKAYIPKLTFLSKLELRPINGHQAGLHHYDVVFLRPEDDWLAR